MKSADFFDQYSSLLRKAAYFDNDFPSVKLKIWEYIHNAIEEVDYLDEPFNPFYVGAVTEPIIMLPYLFNAEKDKMLVMVLVRTKNLSDVPVDYVKFIVGEKSDYWSFSLRRGYVRTFQYEGDIPFLSDTEIGLRVISSFIELGYLIGDQAKLSPFYFKDFVQD